MTLHPSAGSGFTVRRRPQPHASDLGGYALNGLIDRLLFRRGCATVCFSGSGYPAQPSQAGVFGCLRLRQPGVGRPRCRQRLPDRTRAPIGLRAPAHACPADHHSRASGPYPCPALTAFDYALQPGQHRGPIIPRMRRLFLTSVAVLADRAPGRVRDVGGQPKPERAKRYSLGPSSASR